MYLHNQIVTVKKKRQSLTFSSKFKKRTINFKSIYRPSSFIQQQNQRENSIFKLIKRISMKISVTDLWYTKWYKTRHKARQICGSVSTIDRITIWHCVCERGFMTHMLMLLYCDGVLNRVYRSIYLLLNRFCGKSFVGGMLRVMWFIANCKSCFVWS